MKSWTTTVIVLFVGVLVVTEGLRITGQWNTATQRVKILTKFGFQQTSRLHEINTRGYVFGNITTQGNTTQRPVVFALVPETHIWSLHSDSTYGASCGHLLNNLSQTAYESRCFNTGVRSDLFRWIPCEQDQICKDEDTPANVLPKFQLTMQVQEPSTAEYWYIVMVACDLDNNCNWTSSKTDQMIDYDIWLTNGRPASDMASPLTLQFSFDEQDTVEMYAITLTAYLAMCVLVRHALFYRKNSQPAPRLKLLSNLIYVKTAGVSLQCLNALLFSVDGEGIYAVRVLGELLRMFATDLVCLLLILLSRGWGLSTKSDAVSKCTVITWATMSATHCVFFFCNIFNSTNSLYWIDTFSSWPGYGMLFIRILYAMWFLINIRGLISREQDEERAVFMAHVGAGFLVWLVYLPGLGVVASFISLLWRYKIILGITTLANFSAIACLLHLFWPTSSYRKFFQDDLNGHRRMGRTDSHELQDYERLLFESSDSEPDFPELDDTSASLHAI